MKDNSIFFILFCFGFVNSQECRVHPQNVTEDDIINFNPYPVFNESCEIYTWSVSVNGSNIIIAVDYLELDADSGDFLTISPGSALTQDESSIVITGKIESRKFQVMKSSDMFLQLVVQARTNETNSTDYRGFKLSYTPYGEITTEAPSTTPVSTLPTAPEYVNDEAILYISGSSPANLVERRNEIKKIMANMTTEFCSAQPKPIELLGPVSTENVRFIRITECPRIWPEWETCTKITVKIPLDTKNTSVYELTGQHIEEMWNAYNTRLEPLGLKAYQEPDAVQTMWWWVGTALGVIAVFSGLMIVAWRRCDVLGSMKKEPIDLNEPGRISDMSNHSWITISHSYQEVPPMTDYINDTYDKPTNPTASPEVEEPKHSVEFKGGWIFSNRLLGYDNPGFTTLSEEIPEESKDHPDGFISDELQHKDKPQSTRENLSHQYEDPKEKDNNESAL